MIIKIENLERLDSKLVESIPVECKDKPMSIVKYEKLIFLTIDFHLGGGKYKDIRVWDGEWWKFMESKRGFGKFSRKDLDRIVENIKLGKRESNHE
ncbi:MAG: hypothetical protein QQN41_06125 [Nitrosopumilus sp.]